MQGFRCRVSAQPPAKKTAGQIGKETLMLFVQPQRHQGTKITVKFIGSVPIIDLMI
jgi:hypothetical protein